MRAMARIAALFCAAAAVFAQSFNVDFGGPDTAVPDAAYGGAAGWAGIWTQVSGGYDRYDLTHGGKRVDPNTDPNQIGVTLSFNLPFGPSFTDAEPTVGDEAALLDDYFDLRSVPSFARLDGLAAGRYRIVTYAWAPDSEFFHTFVTVDGNVQQIGGVWPGGLQPGVVYADHEALVAPGEPVTVQLFGLPKGTLNGMQIVLLTPFDCSFDLSGDGRIDLDDLLVVLGDFGCAGACAGDLNGNAATDLDDLLLLLGFFGEACAP